MFKFELTWLLREGFMEMVRDIWIDTQWVGRLWRSGKAKSVGYNNT
jgi:hypothetical protein